MSGTIITVTYEEWQKLSGAEEGKGTIIEKHPEWFEFGKADDGYAVARMTKEGIDAHLRSLEKEVGLAPNTLSSKPLSPEEMAHLKELTPPDDPLAKLLK